MVKELVVRLRAAHKSIRLSWSNQGRRFFRILQLFFLSLVLLNTACSTLNTSSNDRGHTREPSALGTAALDPNTWIPLAAAALIAGTDTDEDISDWATDHNPVYGSQSAAQDASDLFRGTLAASAVTVSFMAPGVGSGLLSGSMGNLAIAATAAYTTSFITSDLKNSSGRVRPNGFSDSSFPSSHTSAASTYAAISSYQVKNMPISAGASTAWSIGFRSLAIATGWARVEANAHYPTDVLVGYALGNFTAVWLTEAFKDPKHVLQFDVKLDTINNQIQFNFNVPF